MSTQDSSEMVLEGGGMGPLEDMFLEDNSDETDYLTLTRSAYNSSTDYIEANLKDQWERNINNFLSMHPPGSKYRTESYKYRSRLFRPKTRASIRSKEAALAMAFFSTSDIMTIKASDDSDINAVDSARVMQELVNMRLKKTLKWFLISIGAFQDAQVMGVAISHQYWDYEEKINKIPRTYQEYDSSIGQVVTKTKYEDQVEVIRDRPVIELVEAENLRIDPGADWTDPITSSPYLIELIPMYVIDVLDKMKRKDTKTGQPQWKKMDISEIVRASTNHLDSDSTRLAREGTRQDSISDQFTDVNDHKIVWVFRVIMRIPGKGDMLWYTLGEDAMLTDPVPLKEVYLHNMRPYTMGQAVIEAHRNYPSGTAELGQDMQAAANETLNQRFDNVKQALNKRYFVRRGSTVDLRSLRRSVPGSIVMMGDTQRDVNVQKIDDVTSSAYQEQQLFNVDFDEITGGFSQSNVQGSRQMNETVGGMRMLKDPSNTITEYLIRTFAETWVVPTLRQLVALEQAYETDETVIKIAGKKAKINRIPYGFSEASLDIEVNVGFGITDPQARVGRLLYGIDAIAKLAPDALQKLKSEEVTKEIFGILGYQDGQRFFRTEEEQQQHSQKNPPAPSPDMLKIESTEKIAMAKLELERLIAEETIQSDERKKAADIKAMTSKNSGKAASDLLKNEVEIERVNTEKLGLAIKREDMLRKDAEIKDKERASLSRSPLNSGQEI